MEENKYKRGKIYKIVDNTNGNIYIGSTCEPTLARRLVNHKTSYRSYLNGTSAFMSSFDILKNNDYDIVLIENCPCNNRDELYKRERHYIETSDCINRNVVGRTKEEYRLVNLEKCRESCRMYQEKNKAKYRKSHLCSCGYTYQYIHKSRHMKSQKHIKKMANTENIKKLFNEADTLFLRIDEVLTDTKHFLS